MKRHCSRFPDSRLLAAKGVEAAVGLKAGGGPDRAYAPPDLHDPARVAVPADH